MKSITVSLNPVYYCNFSCSFCYLTPKQLNDKLTLPLELVNLRLKEVSDKYNVEHIDLYGGELLLLEDSYLKGLLSIVKTYAKNISLITNLSLTKDIILDPMIKLTTSYDFTAREKSELVFGNLLTLTRSFSVITLVSRKLLDEVTVDELVHTFNLLSNLESVDLKPYSENQANCDSVTYKEFEEFVWAVLVHPDRNWNLQNEELIDSSLSGERNSYSDDHIYITPKGEYAVLEFDSNDREFFLPLQDLGDYETWCVAEKVRVEANIFCGSCTYKGRCLSEHLKDVKSLDNSCNGFYGLLKRCENDSST